MRYPGQNAAGRAPGRRQSPSGQDVPPRPGQAAGRDQPGGESAVFTPGYRDGRPATADPAGDAPRPGSRYGWAGAAAAKGPVRGFPPAPGQPPPLYPPGQFSAWNRTSWTDSDGQADDYAEDYAAGSSLLTAGHPAAGYSDLAVRDPAADVTSTQTWGAVTDGQEAGTWTSQLAPDDDRQADAWTHRRAPGAGLAPAEPQGPARGSQAQPAGASPPAAQQGAQQGTQPGRARGHGSGAHSIRGAAPRAGRKKPSRVLLAAALAVLVVLAGGTYVVLRGGHGFAAAPAAKPGPAHTAPSAAPSTPAPSPSSTLGPWRHIASRAADPLPLTLAEAFPASFTAGASYSRTVYSRTVRRQGKRCSAAVVGAQLQHAVRRPGCSQVLRASYLSVSKKLMGTIGVLNLKTFKAAERAGKAAGPAEFIAQLAAAKGPTRNLTKGTGIEQADVKGHYLILVWAEFTTLHKPKSRKQRKELETFMSLLINKTVNASLTRRMVTGKP